MTNQRRQLTLFTITGQSSAIENIRRQFNPRQHEYIASHVTLCRDEELDNSELLLDNLRNLRHHSIVLRFGDLVRFSEGKGLLLPAVGGISEFQSLRNSVLRNAVVRVKTLQPHITLMHPRNSTCTDEIFEQLQGVELPKALEFKKISLIEQSVGGKWDILSEFNLYDRT